MPIKTINSNTHCTWIDITTPTEEDLRTIEQQFNIDRLFLEDTTDPNHLPKFEQDKKLLFYLMREYTPHQKGGLNSISEVSSKLSLFILKDVIITIHRMDLASIESMKKKISENPEGYRAEDIALELALSVLRSFDNESNILLEEVDKKENEIFLGQEKHSSQLRKLYRLKRKSGLSTRVLSMSSLWVERFSLLPLTSSQLEDLKDTYRDVVTDFDHLNAQIANLISMFIALSDQKANNVMKILAVYSMYFLPITFIAGVYGMNFDIMPELHTQYGYFACLLGMGIIVLITFFYVRKKKWL